MGGGAVVLFDCCQCVAHLILPMSSDRPQFGQSVSETALAAIATLQTLTPTATQLSLTAQSQGEEGRAE